MPHFPYPLPAFPELRDSDAPWGSGVSGGVGARGSGAVPEPVEEAERAPKLPSLVERCSAEFAASRTIALAPVVQTLDSAIHRINHYPLDSVIDFRNTYPLDSDLSGG